MAMKTYTLEEMEDKHIGKVGTPERDKYEQELAEEIQAYHLGEAIKEARLSMNLTQEQLDEPYPRTTRRNGWSAKVADFPS